jgi:hypothetical protein
MHRDTDRDEVEFRHACHMLWAHIVNAHFKGDDEAARWDPLIYWLQAVVYDEFHLRKHVVDNAKYGFINGLSSHVDV